MNKISKTLLRQDGMGVEIGARIFLFILFLITDDATPFRRQIQPEEVWLYKFPHSEDFIRAKTVILCNVSISLFIIWIIYKINRNRNEAVASILGGSMSLLLSMVVPNFIKLVVGRPRPDFFARCYHGTDMPSDPEELAMAVCPGPEDMIIQGYKSFPSGHSSMAFGGMAYLSFYIAWSLKVFQRSQLPFPSLRLFVFLTPLILATLVAASRTCDYHHHWQDVTVGSILGIFLSYLSYRQGFPSFLESDDKASKIVPMSPPIRELAPLTGIRTF